MRMPMHEQQLKVCSSFVAGCECCITCLQAAAFERVAAACAVPFRGTHASVMRVQPFGSYANGLSLAESDIDVVIIGILEPDDERGGE